MGLQINTLNTDASEPEMMLEMNTTPLIDVMLVLIIMLIITIPVQLHALNLDLPGKSTSVPPTTAPEVIRVVVRPDGLIDWNGELLGDSTMLEKRLAALALQTPPPELHLRPEATAPYGAVAHERWLRLFEHGNGLDKWSPAV